MCGALVRWTVLGFGLACLALAPDVAAEPSLSTESEDSDASGIVPPRPRLTHVEPPVDPEQTELVLLELVVDEQGRVTESRVLEGPSPFAEAALSASQGFEFAPARRLGRPVAARIRFLVRFEPSAEIPLPEPTAANAPVPAAASVPTRVSTEPTIEVEVVGVRPAYATSVITRTETRELAGTFGDPLRAIESRPGVMPVFSGVPYFFVRGAPPGNVGFFLDGVRVPLLYHALLGPSVVHPGLIEHVEFYEGAAPARFGHYAGAIVSAETRPPLTRLGGEGNVRVFDAGALVETPFADGRGHGLIGGRYSYTALAASLLSDAHLEYWDYQARVDWNTGHHGTLSVFAFGAFDLFEAYDGQINRGGGLEFHRVDFRHDVVNSTTDSRVALTLGYDETASNAGFLHDELVSVRSRTRYRPTPEVGFEVGHDLTLDSYTINVDPTIAAADDIAMLFPSRTDLSAGLFGELHLAPSPVFSIAPGFRVNAYRIRERTATAVDARLSVSMAPRRGLVLTESLGLTHQPPNYVPQVPAAQVGSLEGGLQQAVQASSGAELELGWEVTASATAFRSQFFDLLDPIGRDHDFSFDPAVLTRRERGSSLGLELGLRRPLTERVGGFVSYTLSRTERSDGARESLSAFDRPHILQGALALELFFNIRAGLRGVYYSGVPARRIRENASRSVFGDADRAPGFFRLDVRLEKRWPIAGRGYWALVAEMLNATLSREVTSRNCVHGACVDEYSGPVAIPSIGLELYSY